LKENYLRIGPAGITTEEYEKKYLELLELCKKNGFKALEMELLNVRGPKSYPPTAVISNLKRKASEYDVSISVHASYYINFASHNQQIVNMSIVHILESMKIADILGTRVVVHTGYYQQRSSHESIKTCIKNLKKLVDISEVEKYLRMDRIYLEIPGKYSVIGNIDELLEIAKEIGCYICVDWAHLYARNPSFITYSKIIWLIDKIEKNLGNFYWHMHISGMKRNNNGEIKHISFRKSLFPIDTVMIALKDIGLKGTLICESPRRFLGDTNDLIKIWTTGKLPFPKIKRLDEFFK